MSSTWDNAVWSSAHGDQAYEQTTYLLGDNEHAWINATLGTTFNTTAHPTYFGIVRPQYYDCELDYVNNPDMHFYRCADSNCFYCGIVSNMINTIESQVPVCRSYFVYGRTGINNAPYTPIDQIISYTRFVEKFDQTDENLHVAYEDMLISNDNKCDDDDDDDEDEDEEYDNEDEENYYDDGVFSIAEIIDPNDYHMVENCWIAPNGNLHYVPYCNHDLTATRLGFSGTYSAERAGYIHVSVYWDRTNRFVSYPNNPTNAQKETATLFVNAWDNTIDLPEELKFESPKDEVVTVTTYTFWNNVNMSCKSRSLRDRFYPLSGD